MENQLESPSKKKRKTETLNANVCCLCFGAFTEDNSPVTPNETKLDSLFKACTSRQDEIGLKLLEERKNIDDGVLSIKYHRHCRSSYTSTDHIKRAEAQNSVEEGLPLSERRQNNFNIKKLPVLTHQHPNKYLIGIRTASYVAVSVIHARRVQCLW